MPLKSIRYRFVLFTFFLQIHSIKWRPLAFIVAYAHIWCCCILIAFPKYDLLIRDQSSFYRFYDPSNNHLQKKIPSLFTSLRKGEYFGPEAILVKKSQFWNVYQLTLVALDKIVTSCQFRITELPKLKALHHKKKVHRYIIHIFHVYPTSMVVWNLSEYFDQRVLTPKSLAPKLQIFQRGRTENALLEQKYISQQHAT